MQTSFKSLPYLELAAAVAHQLPKSRHKGGRGHVAQQRGKLLQLVQQQAQGQPRVGLQDSRIAQHVNSAQVSLHG